MTDNRSQTTPAPPAQDWTATYRGDVRGHPLMQGPEDMPATPWLDTVTASFRSARRDIPGYTIDSDTDEYRELVDAVAAVTGKPWTIYVNPQTGQTDREGVWRDVAAWRASHPGAFKGVPATREEFDRRASAKTKAAAAADAGTSARGPLTAQFVGGIGASLTDPFVVGTLPLGGGGATAAERIVFQGLANAGVTAATLPLSAIERAKRGESLTAGEAVTDVLAAGAGGAVFQGVIGEPLSALFRRVVGPARMTEDEVAATHVLDRAAEVAATSPYEPGAASESHAARLDAAMREIVAAQEPPRPVAGASVPRETVRGTPAYAGAGIAPSATVDDLFEAVIAQESGGHRGVTGPDTKYGNAHGMTQVLDSTGEGVAKKLGIEWRPDLMRGTSEEAAAYQRRIGRAYFEEGLARYHGDVRKALMYYHGGPDEAKWGPKTRAYADQVLARTHGGPVVRRDLYPEGDAGEAAWAEAQRQSEIADLEIAQLRRGGEAPAEPSVALGSEIGDIVPRETLAPAADVSRAAAPGSPPVAFVRRGDFYEAVGADADRVGAALDIAVTKDRSGQKMVGIPSHVASDWAAELERKGIATDLPRDTAIVPLDQGAHSIEVGPTRIDFSVATDDRVEVNSVKTPPAARGQGHARRAMQQLLAAADQEGRTTFLSPEPLDQATKKGRLTEFYKSLGFVKNSGRVKDFSSRAAMLRLPEEAPRASALGQGDLIADGRPLPSTMAAAGAVAVHDADVQLAATAAKAFDDPHGPAAIAQAAGLTHDLKASLDSGELGAVPFAARGVETINGDAAPVYLSARSLLDSLDMEDAAIAALRACL